MNQDNYTEISLIDLFAYLIKKFWVLLIGSFVGMVLLLSYHFISSNSEKKIEVYEKSLSKYKVELSSLESTLDNLNLKLDFANEVELISPFFGDGQVFVSRIMITVDSNLVSDSESASNAIGQEISSFWNSLDLASIVGSNQDNDVLKASIIFERAGQSASIRVYAEDKNIAEKHAASIVDAFDSYFDNREHLSIGSKTITTSLASKNEIAKIKEQFVSDKAELLKKVFNTESEIKALKKEAPSKYHPLKNAVIGFFVGGIVFAVVLGLGFVLRNPVTCSFNTEKALAVPFLGALFIDTSFLSKLARRIMLERSFNSHNDSVEFLKSSFSTKAFTNLGSNYRIAIISSVNDSEVEKKANEVQALLNSEGHETTFVGNSSENPLTTKTIEDCDALILLERQWISSMLLMSMNNDFSSRKDKRILGFIIC